MRSALPFAILACVLGGCGGPEEEPGPEDPVRPDPQEMPPPGHDPLPLVACAGAPDAGPRAAWRHGLRSAGVLLFGAPRHRGIDLVTGAAAPVQRIQGKIAYGALDKDLEDEQVDLFACRAGAWHPIGSTLTDGDGRFELGLTGAARLPVGQRPLYVSVAGDRSGVAFLALVLPPQTPLCVSDIDGTLTSAEGAYPESLLSGRPVAAHEGAAEALGALAARRYPILYLSSRGQLFTEPTRAWLRGAGLPVGPLRLAPQVVTLPGAATADFKAGVLGEIAATGLRFVLGIGNRRSDAEAYERVAVAPQRIYLKQPEFRDETAPLLLRGEAVGFESYRALVPEFQALPPAF